MNSHILLALFFLSGCGYSSVHNELAGQAKKVVYQTPILCDARTDVDVSLGVMRNGVGSMSTEDEWFTVPNPEDAKLLEKAATEGKIVKVKYDVKRFTWCWWDHIVTGVEIVE